VVQYHTTDCGAHVEETRRFVGLQGEAGHLGVGREDSRDDLLPLLVSRAWSCDDRGLLLGDTYISAADGSRRFQIPSTAAPHQAATIHTRTISSSAITTHFARPPDLIVVAILSS
jgi:hypothetical protein